VRVIDCDCGQTLQAANDDDLAQRVREHMDDRHSDMELTEDGVRELVADKAYTASDS
jgi:predicted small metal-binding protein